MAERAYRAAPAEALRVEPLGELTAIFDRRSVQTHLVVSPMPEMLAAMAGDACTASDLAVRLSKDFDLDAAGDPAAVVAERLAELAAIDVVDGSPPLRDNPAVE